MYSEKIISQSHVLSENGMEYTLEYYIFSESIENGNALYGAKIVQYSDESTTSASATISLEEEHTLQTILHFAKNFVFPNSLHDIIEDMQDERIQ